MDIWQCFEILELDTDASIDDVNQAYKDLAAVWHPDRFSSNPRLKHKAEEKLKTVNQAYENVLSFLSAEQGTRKIVPSPGVASRSPGSYRSDGILKGTSKKGSLLHSTREPIAESHLRPWVRCFARIIDYLFFAFLLKLIAADNIFPETEFRVLFIPAILAFAWIIP
ncbi:MAG: J domain-containing protein, partial [Deltaproteobacteria bacterium]|nr:J domain-containing protein [Deltaproteobacteria bacterium]